MSASREKQARRDQVSSGWVSPKTAREAKMRKEEQRNNLLYAIIGGALVLVVVAAAIWNSNVIPRMTTAVTANGKNYTAAQVDFYYHINYNSTINRWGYMASYIGLNTGAALDVQTVSESTAEMLETEPGITWEEYFIQKGIETMVSTDAALAQAKEEGYVFPDSIQEEYDEALAILNSQAGANGLSMSQYIKAVMGGAVTERIYRTELKKYLQFQDYASHVNDSLDFTEDDLIAGYEENPQDYDLISYETIYVRGSATPTTDEDGNTIEPTEEEEEAAKAAAKVKAEEVYAAYQAGATLESLEDTAANAFYYAETEGAYSNLGEDLGKWIYEDGRKEGDSGLIPSGDNYYIAHFRGKGRDEQKTVNIRHILIKPAEGELSSEDEGYEDEQAQLTEAAKAKAEEIYKQWQDGEATEDSFAELAKEYSEDSNASQGGIYERVYEGQMVDTFNEWCFDPVRKTGDTGIVETTYGFHIMYYVSDSLPHWQAQVYDDLKAKTFEDWSKSLYEDSGLTRHDFGMGFVE